MKAYRSYVLATLPFIAFFAYQILVVLPHRPKAGDGASGYTIPLELGDSSPAHYISLMDAILTFGALLCAAVIMGIGIWRSGAFARRK